MSSNSLLVRNWVVSIMQDCSVAEEQRADYGAPKDQNQSFDLTSTVLTQESRTKALIIRS